MYVFYVKVFIYILKCQCVTNDHLITCKQVIFVTQKHMTLQRNFIGIC